MAEFHFQPLPPREGAWTYDQNGKKRTLDYIWERQDREKRGSEAHKREAWVEELIDWTSQPYEVNYHRPLCWE
eukprot:5236230-Prorocentrum_lima.AAC.1